MAGNHSSGHRVQVLALFVSEPAVFSEGEFAKHHPRSQVTRVTESHEAHFVN